MGPSVGHVETTNSFAERLALRGNEVEELLRERDALRGCVIKLSRNPGGLGSRRVRRRLVLVALGPSLRWHSAGNSSERNLEPTSLDSSGKREPRSPAAALLERANGPRLGST